MSSFSSVIDNQESRRIGGSLRHQPANFRTPFPLKFCSNAFGYVGSVIDNQESRRISSCGPRVIAGNVAECPPEKCRLERVSFLYTLIRE